MKTLINTIRNKAINIAQEAHAELVGYILKNDILEKAQAFDKAFLSHPLIVRMNSKIRSTGYTQVAMHWDKMFYVPTVWRLASQGTTTTVALETLNIANAMTPDAAIDKHNVPHVDLSYPIVVDTAYRIIDGRHRWTRAKELGLTALNVVILDTTTIPTIGTPTMFGPQFAADAHKHILKEIFKQY